MSRTIGYEDGGAATCGYCGNYFGYGQDPHEVIRRTQEGDSTYTYVEAEPWHEECIARANTDIKEERTNEAAAAEAGAELGEA